MIQGWLENKGWRLDNGDIKSMMSSLHMLESEIQEKFYEFYSTIPPDNKVTYWKNLIEGIKEMHHSVEIFTTNYDLVLDHVVDSIRSKVNIYSGKFGGRAGISHINIDDLIETETDEDSENFVRSMSLHGKFIKLHGSINWTWMGNDIIVGPPLFTGDHSRHAIYIQDKQGLRKKDQSLQK